VSAGRVFERIVRASARRPGRVLGATVLLTVVFAGLALKLEPSAATDSLVGRSSSAYEATERYRERFGEQSVVILVQGDLANLVLTANIDRLLGLEGCLSGNKPADQPAPGGAGSACAELAKTKPVQVVYGPARSSTPRSGRSRRSCRAGRRRRPPKPSGPPARRASWPRAGAVQGAAAEGRAVGAPAGLRQLLRDLLRINLTLRPRADRRADDQRPQLRAGARVRREPRARARRRRAFAYLFPSSSRRDPGAAQDEPRRRAAARRDRADPARRVDARVELDKGTYTVTARPSSSRTWRTPSPAPCCGCSSSRWW
jgi:hypothetical protein